MTFLRRGGFTPIILALLIAVGVLAVGAGALYYYAKKQAPSQIACTQEAKLCPDGSYVSRTGPNCEFEACPSTDSTGSPQASSGQPSMDLGQSELTDATIADPFPPLFLGVKWEEINSEKIPEGRVYVSVSPSESRYINLPGKFFEAKITDVTQAQFVDGKVGAMFQQYYRDETGKDPARWLNQVEVNRFDLYPVSADGPRGSFWGYLFYQPSADAIWLLGLSYGVNYRGPRVEEYRTCPCDVTLHVFESDQVKASEISKTAGFGQ